MCGGTRLIKGEKRGIHGLSPRVRGNLRTLPPASYAARSIPACAGEPTRKYLEVRLERVYPRVCGGTTLLAG